MENPKIEQARHLYFAQAKTQKEIAHILDVSEKTIYNWIKRHSWDQLRQAARQAPALISENLCSQVVELQNSIARREPGSRYATKEESQIMQRLITMLEKMKKFPSLSVHTQVLETFRNWMRPRDKAFTRDLSLYAGLFLQGYPNNGYYPYQLEFGIDSISPVDPFYEEEPATDVKCHPEPAEGHHEPVEGHPEPAEGMVSSPEDNVILSLSKDIPSLPRDILSLPNDDNKIEKQQPENPTSAPTQPTEDQRTYNNTTHVPPPEKTGKTPATPDRSDDFPWRKWIPGLTEQRSQFTANYKGGKAPKKE